MSTRRQLFGASATTLAMAAIAAKPLRALAQDDDDDDDDGGATGTRIAGNPVFRPEIDLVRAQEIALDGNSGAVVTKVELDGDDGVLEYSISLDNGVTVDIDATTGAVIRTDRDDDDDDNGDDDAQSTGTSSTSSGDDDDDDGDDDDG